MVDVADLTGDGLVDVVATSPTQMQMVLFVQPANVAERGYDWYTVADRQLRVVRAALREGY